MKKTWLIIIALTGLSAFAQTNQVAPGAAENFQSLLNNPGFFLPTTPAAMGRNWFRMETDTHMFTDEVSIRQVIAVLLDLENQTQYFNGKKNKLSTTVVQYNAGETIVDIVSITPALGLQIKTPYGASVKVLENSGNSFYVEIRQLAADSDSNKNIKNCITTRYASEVTIDGKTYTYIRFYVSSEVNASILPGARGILASSSDAANAEALQLIVSAAKTK